MCWQLRAHDTFVNSLVLYLGTTFHVEYVERQVCTNFWALTLSLSKHLKDFSCK